MLNGLKTYIGIALTALASILHANGIDYDMGALISQTSIGLDAIGQVIGLALALYGRMAASKPGILAKPAEPQP